MLLGRIEGTQESHGNLLKQQGELLQSIDARLRDSEQANTRSAVISSSVVGVGMALLIEGFKGWMSGRGGNS